MFKRVTFGYDIQEVEKYIKKLRSDCEAKIMEEKLKVLEAEKKVLDYKNKSQELENREKNILSALDMFKKYQEEGNRNIDALRLEQLKMIKQEFLALAKVILDMNTILENQIDGVMTSPTKTDNDPMRMLLNKIRGTRRAEQPRDVELLREKETQPREVRITRNNPFDSKSQIKPVTNMTLEEGDNYATLVDKFLSTRPEGDDEKVNGMEIQSNGFDLKEAVMPKDDLAEIMKAFDFFGGNDK